MDAREARVLYLAVADGRGHLMRAHLVRALLGRAGLAVDVVTTSRAGQAFLAGLGTPAALLAGGFELSFDDRHRMLARQTERRLARYLVSPRGLARDARRLTRLAAGARFIVNDSLHPAALALAAARGRGGAPRVVDLHGENLWRAAAGNFEGRMPGWASGAFRRLLETVDGRAHGRIVHSLAAADRGGRKDGANRFRLPPLVAGPRRTRAAVRRALGLGEHDRLAAVYLNPHFRDPRVAAGLEAALAGAGLRFYGVSEPWAARPGWRACDPDLGDVVAASDLLVSGAGAAALEQARRARVPLLALMGDQPEQRLNHDQARAAGVEVRAIDVGALASLPREIEALMAAAPSARLVANDDERVRRLWTDAFLSLAGMTKEAEHGTRSRETDDRPGAGDEQPRRRRRWPRRRRAQPGAVAGPLAGPDLAAHGPR